MSHAWGLFCKEKGLDPNDREAMRLWFHKPMPKNDDGTPAYITQQSDKDAADINKIVERFDAKDIMGLQGQFTTDESILIDVTSMDYKEAMDLKTKVEQEFGQLRPDVRATFDNDAAKYVDFLGRPTEAKDQVKEIIDKIEGKTEKKAPQETVEAPKMEPEG